MKRAFRATMLLAMLVVAGAAHGQPVRWTYVEGGGGALDPEHGGREYGWLVSGSVDLGKLPLHIAGEWGKYDPYKARWIGAGWHGLLGEKADLFADGAFYDADVEDGFKIRFGVGGGIEWGDNLNTGRVVARFSWGGEK